MGEFKAGEVVIVKATKEKVVISEVRKTDIGGAGNHIDYWCEYVGTKRGKRFAPSELTRS